MSERNRNGFTEEPRTVGLNTLETLEMLGVPEGFTRDIMWYLCGLPMEVPQIAELSEAAQEHGKELAKEIAKREERAIVDLGYTLRDEGKR